MFERGDSSGAAVLLREQVSRKDTAGLVGLLADREQQIRRLQAEQAAAVAEIEARGVFAETGYPTTGVLLRDVLHLSHRDGRLRAERATAMQTGVSFTGAAILALVPRAADALADGAIGCEHVDQIRAVMSAIPAAVSDGQRDEVERALVELAEQASPQQVVKAGRHALALFDPDGKPPNDKDNGHDPEQARPGRILRLGWRKDGRLGFTGTLDKESGERLHRLLSPLAKPQPSPDGARDARTVQERDGDALAELLEQAERTCDHLPVENGHRPTVVVTLDYDRLCQQLAGVACVGDEPITAEQARRLACDADLIPAVLGTDGQVLDLGRTHRLATAAQRRALTIRDRGCVKCGRPAQWCQAHHIVSWLDGGVTDVANMCLLCSACHRLVHHAGWTIQPDPNGGRPTCHPPNWFP